MGFVCWRMSSPRFCKPFFLIGLVVCIVQSALGLYPANSDVIQLDNKNFDKLVLQSDHLWIVEFYAPWCGHCKALAPEYNSLATSLKGLVRVGAVNADEDKQLGGRFQVRGFPTIKVFGANKKSPIDYNGGRTAKDMSEFLTSRLPSVVTELQGTNGDGEKFLGADRDIPKVLLFSAKPTVTPLYKTLSIDYNGRLQLAQVGKSATALVEKYGITDYPTLIVIPSAAGSEAVKYSGPLTHVSLFKFLGQYALPEGSSHIKKQKVAGSSAGSSGGSSSSSSSGKGSGSEGPDPTVVLTDSNFQSTVLADKNHIWFVEFYAPWCGHCQALQPEWSAMSKNIDGLIKVGKVDTTANQQLAGQYRIEGIPTIKLFGFGDKSNPEDYRGERKARPMVDYALAHLKPTKITSITATNIEGFLSSSALPKVLLFTTKSTPTHLYMSLSWAFTDQLKFGEVHNSVAAVVQRFEVSKFPSLIVVKDDGSHVPFAGELNLKAISAFLSKFASSSSSSSSASDPSASEAPKPADAAVRIDDSAVHVVANQSEFERVCLSRKGLCVVLLDDPRDDQQPKHVAVLNDVAARRSQEGLFHFVLLDGTQQPKFMEFFHVMQLPGMTILNPKQNIYSEFVGALETSAINQYLDKLISGTARRSHPIKGSIPPIADAVELPEEVVDEDAKQPDEL